MTEILPSYVSGRVVDANIRCPGDPRSRCLDG